MIHRDNGQVQRVFSVFAAGDAGFRIEPAPPSVQVVSLGEFFHLFAIGPAAPTSMVPFLTSRK